ncbi:MAG TPA: response regulator transcription factor [Puia sp.]|jgi:DNA-binding NarL/FixJ family response regulator|nr:response regulator transcription factor [Puia sp.]
MRERERPCLHILVADQHRIFRAGIRTLLAEAGSWQAFEVGEAETTEEAIAIVATGRYPVVLIEYNLPGRGGIKAMEIIRSRWPAIAVIAVVETDDGGPAERMIDAGAKGCILRNVGLDTLVGAIRTVMGGRRFFSNEIAQRLLERPRRAKQDPLERLTAKEKQVFHSILAGLRDREIAAQMGIAKRTVDKHRQHIHYKLGTKNALELLQTGLRLGLVRGPE